MITLHLENTVHDFDAWHAAFEKFESFRAERGVRSYRLSRDVESPEHVAIDLDFDTADQALAFRGSLETIWRTPQSREHLITHNVPLAYDLVVERTLGAAV